MNHPPQTGKRIVSKSEYMRRQSWRFGLQMLAVVVIGFGLLADNTVHSHTNNFIARIVGPILMAVCWVISTRFYKKARQITPGIPLTRANSADLPAPDSLVRASEEPKQEQQAVLLRAATESVERHEEQLVRASAEGAE